MEQVQISRVSSDLLYLLRCAARDMQPEEARVADMDMQALYDLAKCHSLSALTAVTLERCGVSDEQWRQAKGNALRRAVLMDAERKAICDFLDSIGCWYLPMKGVLIQELYPRLGTREMSDNDILFDAAYQDAVHTFMETRGYTTDSIGAGHHDSYSKPPVFHFEMHTSLVTEMTNPVWCAYYQDVRSRLLPCGGKTHALRFSDEDFYIYFQIHGCKHYRHAGNGIRSLLDIYFYLRAKEASMDWDYIHRECRDLGIEAYEQRMRTLSYKLFGSETPALTQEEQKDLAYMLSSGTYGTALNRMQNTLRKIQASGELSVVTKLRYLLGRIFPDRAFMAVYCAPVRFRLWMYPFVWIYRFFKIIFLRTGVLVGELKLLWRGK